jgi:hypothetical protein
VPFTHGALELAAPLGGVEHPGVVHPRNVRRRDVLGGLIHEYYPAAA